MRGLTLDGVRQISVHDELPDPTIQHPGDVIVRVRHAGLCGSDLHPYVGREPCATGIVPGHEAIGEVIETGDAVRGVAIGQRVLVPFTTSCGECWACTSRLTARCMYGQLFGWGPSSDPDAALHGAQADLLRVPLADSTLVGLPEGMDPLTAVLLADNMPTAWEAVSRCGDVTDETVVVIGCGSVGLCAVAAARARGAATVVAIDPVADRRDRAAVLGAVIAPPDDAPKLVAAAAGDIPGSPAVIEAAGTPAAQALAAQLVRPGGTVSLISVQTDEAFAFTPVAAYDRNLRLATGRASVRATVGELLPLVEKGALRVPTDLVVTHPQARLEDGAQWYRRFADREDGLVKAVFDLT